MRILNVDFDFDAFYKILEGNGDKLLFLDYDGTLAPFNDEPKLAFPYPGVPEILDEIIKNSSTRIVIISGRSIQELEPVLGINGKVEIWGTHGRERQLPDGSYHRADATLEQSKGLGFGIAKVMALEPQIRAEPKPGAVAFHWRGIKTSRVLQLKEEMPFELEQIAVAYQLAVKSFDGGMELIVPGQDKGTAVREVLREVNPDTAIAYLGDDLTDEDAFWEVKYKGLSVLVTGSLRDTQADLWLQPPEELLGFLEKWKG